METTLAQRKTYADYALLPDGTPAQLIDGEIIMSPAPTTSHQKIQSRLGYLIQHFVIARDLGQVFFTPTEICLSEHDTFQPDLTFVSRGRSSIIEEDNIKGAPDLVVEILSPSTGYLDLTHKKTVYETSGVKEFWIVDPKEKLVEVQQNTPNGFVTFSKARGTGKVRSSILNGFEVDIAEVFAGL
ncbi:MAG: Uma2 family endonuclease [Ignavibacteriae bacterium]|nr:Uma2 family endonuclease [Ignavibacteriota bacterium]